MKNSKRIISFLLSLLMLFSTLAVGSVSSAAECYEQEDNNTANKADYISLNSSLTGVSTDYNDDDWFKFTVSQNGKVDISLSHDYSSSGFYWKITFYKDTGNETREEINSMSVYSDAGTGSFPTYGLKPGTYYIQIYAGSSNSTKYKININFTATESWEKEFNDTAYDANTIKVNSSLTGISTDYNDDDWFRFTVSKNSKIDISLSHNHSSSGFYWKITFYKDTGNETREEIDSMSVYSDAGTGSFPTYGLKPGTYYIRIYAGSSNSTPYTLKVSTHLNKPSSFKVSSYKTTSIRLKWSSVSGTDGYQLQRKSGDKYKSVKTTTKTSYTVTDLSKGKKYSFRVRAYINNNGTKIYSDWVYLSAGTAPSAPKISSVKTSTSHKITAIWKKVSPCTGYQIRLSKTKSFKSYTGATVGSSTTSKTFKSLKKGTKYYVKVRAYKTVGSKKYYSSWSSVKSIKCK